jgi:hypothetical protein
MMHIKTKPGMSLYRRPFTNDTTNIEPHTLLILILKMINLCQTYGPVSDTGSLEPLVFVRSSIVVVFKKIQEKASFFKKMKYYTQLQANICYFLKATKK